MADVDKSVRIIFSTTLEDGGQAIEALGAGIQDLAGAAEKVIDPFNKVADAVKLADAAIVGAATYMAVEAVQAAGKFTAAGTRIDVRWDVAEARVRIVVADEGEGIPPGEEQRIFARYVRGRRSESEGVPGTGLGLSLVRELVQAMDGTGVLLPSESGAVFEIRLREAR